MHLWIVIDIVILKIKYKDFKKPEKPSGSHPKQNSKHKSMNTSQKH
jgi:hypothetical protein